jgi:hypothetical protein
MAEFAYTFRVRFDTTSYERLNYEQTEAPRLVTDGEGDDVFGLTELAYADGLTGLLSIGETEIVVGGTAYRFLVGEQFGFAWLFGDLPGVPLDDIVAAIPTDYLNVLVTIDNVYVCFAPGTLIATPGGERPVETLAIGDAVLTADGRAVAVRWMGRQTVRTGLAGERARPVRVRAGALGPGVPHSDLVLTADHALILDDLAVNAGALVNGTTIAFVPLDALPDAVTYWHVETAAHDTILANGAPAETFVDYVGRKAFDNHREYLDLYGCERIIPEMRRLRISSRRQLPANHRARFGIRAFADDLEADFAEMMARISAA